MTSPPSNLGSAAHHISIHWKDLSIAAALVVLVNLGGIVSPSLNVDDYSQFGGAASAWTEGGRWLLGPLFHWLTLGAHAPAILTLLGSVLLAATGYLIALTLNARERAHRVLIAAAFGGHPYFIDLMNFNTAVFAYPLAFLMTVAAVMLHQATPRFFAIAAGATLFCLSLALYQASLGLFAALYILLAGLKLTSQISKVRINVNIALWPLTQIAALGLLMYFVITRLISSPNSERFALGPIGDHAFSKVRYIYYSLQETLFASEVLLPTFPKILLLSLLFLALISAIIYSSHHSGRPHQWFLFATGIAGSLFVALLASYAPSLPVQSQLPPRAMAGHAAIAAAIIFLVLAFGNRTARAAGVLLSGFLLFQYTVIANELTYKQRLLQSLDMSVASSLRDRISSHPDFTASRTYDVVFVGEHRGPWPSQASVLQSAFARDWSGRDILRLHGLRVTTPSAEALDSALKTTNELGVWPEMSAVTLTEDVIVIRFE